MAVSGRRRLARDAAGAAAALAWARVRARVRHEKPPRAAELGVHAFDSFVTWHDRPKAPIVRGPLRGMASHGPFAIIVQGGVMTESNFTLDSVRTYRAYDPDVDIIVSTWAGLAPTLRAAFEDAGALVIESTRPANPGIGNINLQITSTSVAMRAAADRGAQHAVKTRSDQRIYAPKALSAMAAAIGAFPLPEGLPGGQRSRIVSLGFGSFQLVPYHLSDFLNFGRIEDMLDYWTPPLDPRPPDAFTTMVRTPRRYSGYDHCEVYLLGHFLDHHGAPRDVSISTWWRTVAERFIIVDAAMLDHLWAKYSMREYRHRDYRGGSFFEEFAFADWITLQADPTLASIDVPDDLIDTEFPWPLGGNP